MVMKVCPARKGGGFLKGKRKEFTVSESNQNERVVLPAEAEEVASALSWALDLLDMYDQRLAAIDGVERVYSPTHLEGKAKARKALRMFMFPKVEACSLCGKTAARQGEKLCSDCEIGRLRALVEIKAAKIAILEEAKHCSCGRSFAETLIRQAQ